ncbi:MAG: nitroreductase family protein, partial [archaeon]|nr:nitroreductase family protein [archaeon]
MDFKELISRRQSCRSFDPTKDVEDDKLMACIEAAKLAPSAVNDQPYDIWVAKGEKAAALFETFSGFNKFAKNCPVFVVFTDAPFKCERLGEPGGSGIDYHAQDVGES